MASYRIHRLKEHLQQQFRSAPHVSGVANVKPRDYEPGPAMLGPTTLGDTRHHAPKPVEQIEAATPYAAYFAQVESGHPLVPGDLLEAENGALRIFKYVGFEEAQWVFPEPKAPLAGESVPEQVPMG